MGGPVALQADPFPETIVADFEGSRFVRATVTGQILLTEPPDWCGEDPVPDYPYGSYGARGVVELGGEFGLTVRSAFASMPLVGGDPATFVGEIAGPVKVRRAGGGIGCSVTGGESFEAPLRDGVCVTAR